MYKRTASLTIDSSKVPQDLLIDLEEILYGSIHSNPRLPNPSEIISLLNREILVEDSLDPGTYWIQWYGLVEDPDDIGFFIRIKLGLAEDPSDVGTYLIGIKQ